MLLLLLLSPGRGRAGTERATLLLLLVLGVELLLLLLLLVARVGRVKHRGGGEHCEGEIERGSIHRCREKRKIERKKENALGG